VKGCVSYENLNLDQNMLKYFEKVCSVDIKLNEFHCGGSLCCAYFPLSTWNEKTFL